MKQIIFKQDLNRASIRRLILRVSKKYPTEQIRCVFKNCYLTEVYLKEGKIHNEEGFAIKYKDSSLHNLYYLDDIHISKQEFYKLKAKDRIKQILRD